ncbi:MAG: hypothetical protein R3C26_19960 [Calditrichia bacterium]
MSCAITGLLMRISNTQMNRRRIAQNWMASTIAVAAILGNLR